MLPLSFARLEFKVYGLELKVCKGQPFLNWLYKLERTQRRATKYILNLPFTTDTEYKARLLSLHLLSICYWHEYLDLVFFFKITHGLVTLNTQAFLLIPITRRSTRSTSTNIVKYVISKCKTTTYQKSYLIRSCRIWNTLADELNLKMDNLTTFKSVLFNYYYTSLNINYSPENPRTFKT